jgi:hypothetical protein
MLPHPGVPSKRHPAGCRSLLGCRFGDGFQGSTLVAAFAASKV